MPECALAQSGLLLFFSVDKYSNTFTVCARNARSAKNKAPAAAAAEVVVVVVVTGIK